MPYVGDEAPAGWSVWRLVETGREGTDRATQEVAGRFIAGEGPSHAAGTMYGSETHTHLLKHRHVVKLSRSDATNIAARTHQGPPIALSAHGHEAVVDAEIETGAGSSLPPFVFLSFIVKD